MITMDMKADHYTTLEVASMLGMAVRSVQMMVDRGELEAWKTPGGHRRISRSSVENWVARQRGAGDSPVAPAAPTAMTSSDTSVLLIEDSIHFQNLVSLLVRQSFPKTTLHLAGDGITGLAMYGQLQPDVLIVDILLPGIDGPTLISTLRSHPQFAHSRLIVITSLDEKQRLPYAYALSGVPVVHKDRLVAELPPLLAQALQEPARAAAV